MEFQHQEERGSFTRPLRDKNALLSMWSNSLQVPSFLAFEFRLSVPRQLYYSRFVPDRTKEACEKWSSSALMARWRSMQRVW